MLVYRPPKPDKDFLTEFSNILSHCVSLYDRMLFLGDFNIHVFCPGKPLVNEFCHFLDSFSVLMRLFMYLAIPLTLSCPMGFLLTILILRMHLSDHNSVVFDVLCLKSPVYCYSAGHYSHHINSLTAKQFSESYQKKSHRNFYFSC